MADEPRKWITFDPTIHAGHVMTALTVLGSAIAIWVTSQNTLANHDIALKEHTVRMNTIDARATAERERTDRKFDDLVRNNNEAVGKLRDDMQGWFMALNDKLDRKADKR